MKDIKQRLIQQYGVNFKAPLAKELGVTTRTLRNVFNARDEIPKLYVHAISNVLNATEER